MFVGHYAAALAAKAAEPRAPLWSYVTAAQLVDIGWSGLIMIGAERVGFDPSLPGSALVLEHMPWTHSLPGALAWAVAAALLAGWALKLPRRAAVFVGLVVFSHWLLDLVVHRPDLALWFGGPKVGFGLWNAPVVEQAVEMGLLAVAGAAWAAQRARAGLSSWPAVAFLTFLVVLQIVAMVLPPSGGAVTMGANALAAYLATTAIAALVERRPGSAAARLRDEPAGA
jgi:hypothetical protein